MYGTIHVLDKEIFQLELEILQKYQELKERGIPVSIYLVEG